MKHLVVIPTYNEIENIEDMINELFSLYPEISILVVDDSSPDGTGQKVKQLMENNPNLFILEQSEKSGLANAYINGFKWGLVKGFDLFTSIDADFSHKPIYIKDAVKLIESGVDIACGSRYAKDGNTTEKHWFRNFISIGGNIYADFILGDNIKDWTEGFNTYTKDALYKINLDSIKVKGYIFQAEMKYKAVKAGCIVKEFPILFEERKKGKSKMSSHIIIEALISVLRIKLGK